MDNAARHNGWIKITRRRGGRGAELLWAFTSSLIDASYSVSLVHVVKFVHVCETTAGTVQIHCAHGGEDAAQHGGGDGLVRPQCSTLYMLWHHQYGGGGGIHMYKFHVRLHQPQHSPTWMYRFDSSLPPCVCAHICVCALRFCGDLVSHEMEIHVSVHAGSRPHHVSQTWCVTWNPVHISITSWTRGTQRTAQQVVSQHTNLIPKAPTVIMRTHIRPRTRWMWREARAFDIMWVKRN